jgi:hypothetical protein
MYLLLPSSQQKYALMNGTNEAWNYASYYVLHIDIRILLFALNTSINLKSIAGVRPMLSFMQLGKSLCHSCTVRKCHVFQAGFVVASCR